MAANAGSTAVCSAGTWTITPAGSDFNLTAVTYNLGTDKLRVLGNLNIDSSVKLEFQLNSANTSASALLNVQNRLDWSGNVDMIIADWNRTNSPVTSKIPLALFQSRSAASPQFKVPGLTAPDRVCWRVIIDPLPTFEVYARNLTMVVDLERIPGTECGKNQDRAAVVVFIVIVILWGIGLGVLALVTCKLSWCYSKFWELK